MGVVEQMTIADKLFIEDIGTTVSGDKQESDFSVRTLMIIINRRLEDMKATFLTTNKSLEKLSQSFDSRIASRITQGCEIIKLTGEDRRMRGEIRDVR